MKRTLTRGNYLISLLGIVLLSVFGGWFLTIGIVYLSDVFFHFSLEIYKTTIWICNSLIVLMINLRGLNKQTYDVWNLHNNILKKGQDKDTTFDLNKIEFIAYGIPKPKWIPYIEKILFISSKGIMYASCITIKFKDNTYLVLNMSEIDNGIDLFNKILMDYQDKIIDDYIFTEAEREILKVRNSSRLLRIK